MRHPLFNYISIGWPEYICKEYYGSLKPNANTPILQLKEYRYYQ